MTRPLISVVIPLYNKEKCIVRTLRSVLIQKGCTFEAVIVDDGSTDNSLSVAESITDDHIRIFKQANGGPSKARNTGLRQARGEWVVFLDADDELLPDTLETFTRLITAHPDADIFDCGHIDVHHGRRTPAHHPLEGYIGNPMRECFFARISPGNARSAIRRDYVLQFPFDERIRRFEDAEWLGRLLPGAKVFSTTRPTFLVNHDDSSASHPRKNVMDDYFAYLDFHKGGFWQRMCAYRCFLENRDLYPEYGHRHYKEMYYRYDLLLLFKLLNWWGKHFLK